MNNFEQKAAMAKDNKRKVMHSTIFGDDSIPVNYTPKYSTPDDSGNNGYKSKLQKYQSNGKNVSNDYKKTATFSKNYVNDTPAYVPQIEKIEAPQSLPNLTPFPDFNFDNVPSFGQIDFGVRPNDSVSNLNKQNGISNLGSVEFHAGDELKRIRDDLSQESIINSRKMQQIISDNQNYHMIIDGMKIPRLSSLSGEHHSQNEEIPIIETSSQFMFPDGTTIQNP